MSCRNDSLSASVCLLSSMPVVLNHFTFYYRYRDFVPDHFSLRSVRNDGQTVPWKMLWFVDSAHCQAIGTLGDVTHQLDIPCGSISITICNGYSVVQTITTKGAKPISACYHTFLSVYSISFSLKAPRSAITSF